MNGVNPAVLYYDILLIISALLSGAYLFMWRRHFDVRITLVFALIPVIRERSACVKRRSPSMRDSLILIICQHSFPTAV